MLRRAMMAGASSGAADPYWANVISLLHFNGANGSAAFTDQKGRVWAGTGNAQIATAQSKFGGASLALDGAGDYLTTPYSSEFNFGSSDFTIEAWVRRNGDSRNSCIAQLRNTPTIFSPWGLGFNNSNQLRFVATSQPSVYDVDIVALTSLSTGAWFHVAAVRNGSSFVLYVDGTSVGSATASITVKSVSEPVFCGSNGASSPSFYYNGWIDDLRITKGVARYTSNFTPPSAQFPDG